MSEDALRELLASFDAAVPPIRIVKKSGRREQRAIARALEVLSLGGQRTYLSEYVTTLGRTIFVPDDFDRWSVAQRCEILRHEAVHVAQFERYGWLGMALLYGLFPLPIGLAYGRARLEWEAYAESLRAIAELEGRDAARSASLHASIVRRFTGPDYLWMWPFPKTIERWIADELAQIEASSPTERR